jgi:ribonuclease HI
MNLSTTSAYMAELWGIYEGLSKVKDYGVQNLEVQIDSKVLACSLQEGKLGSVTDWSLIKKIKALLNYLWNVKIIHIYREANRCIDILANIDCLSATNTIVYDHFPQELIQVLADDCRGVAFPRLIAF